MRQRLAAALLALVALCAPLMATADEPTRPESLTIAVFGSVAGEIISMRCRDTSKKPRSDFSRLAGWLRRARTRGVDLVLSTGNLLGDDPFTRFLATRGGGALSRLTAIFGQASMDAVLPGRGEFLLPSGLTVPVLGRLMAGGIPYGAANLECGDSKACRALKAGGIRFFTIRGLRIAVVSLLGPVAVEHGDPRNMIHSKLLPPSTFVNEAVARLKDEGHADLIIAIVYLDHPDHTPTRALNLARNAASLDLVLTAGPGETSDRNRLELVHLDNGRRFLVTTSRGTSSLTRIELTLERKKGGLEISAVKHQNVSLTGVEPDQQVRERLTQTMSEFCALTMRPLRSGRIEFPITLLEFLRYSMEVMRREVGADLAMLSRDSLWGRLDDSLEGAITEEDLNRMVPRWEIRVLEVKGEFLLVLLPELVARSRTSGLEIIGAGDDGGIPTINGRRIEPQRVYRIVTTNYLAMGGRGLLSPLLAMGRLVPSNEPLFLRELLHRFLQRDRPRRIGENRPIRADRDFPSLWELPLWIFMNKATLSFNQVHIENSPRYEEAQLNRSEILGLNGELQARATRSTRAWTWNNFLLFQYGETSTDGGELLETKDITSMESSLAWTALRNRTSKRRTWMPVPMLKGKLETELTPQEELHYHHLEGTLTLGPQWFLAERLSVAAGYGVRNELLHPDDDLHQGVEFSYNANQIPLLTSGNQTVLGLDSRFELFYSDIGAENRLKGLGHTALSIAIRDWFRFNIGLDIQLYREGSKALAWSLDTTAGLSFIAAFSSQKFW